jgi:hypothetical protein
VVQTSSLWLHFLAWLSNFKTKTCRKRPTVLHRVKQAQKLTMGWQRARSHRQRLQLQILGSNFLHAPGPNSGSASLPGFLSFALETQESVQTSTTVRCASMKMSKGMATNAPSRALLGNCERIPTSSNATASGSTSLPGFQTLNWKPRKASNDPPLHRASRKTSKAAVASPLSCALVIGNCKCIPAASKTWSSLWLHFLARLSDFDLEKHKSTQLWSSAALSKRKNEQGDGNQHAALMRVG